MRNIFLITKIYFKRFVNGLNKKKQTTGYKSSALVIGLISLFMLFVFGMNTLSNIELCYEYSISPIYALYQTLLMSLLFLGLLTVLKTCQNKKNNDIELLLSLPFKKSEIVWAKSINAGMYDFLLLVATFLPGIIVYKVVVTDAPQALILNAIIIALLLSMLSSSIGYFFNYFVNLFIKNSKIKDYIQSIITVIVTIAFIGVYYYIAFKFQTDFYETEKIFNVFFFKDVFKVLYELNIESLLLLITMSFIPYFLMVISLSSELTKDHTANIKVDNDFEYKASSPFNSLLKKELRRFLKCPHWIINACFGLLFVIAIGVLTLIPEFKDEYFMSFVNELESQGVHGELSMVIILLITFLASTGVANSSSLSLEGKTVWILKTLPLKASSIFDAKILMNIIVAIIPVLIGSVLAIFGLNLSLEYIPFIILLPILAIIFESILSLMWNLKFYKFDWELETEVIKQGMSIPLSMFTCIIVSALGFIGYFMFNEYLPNVVFLSVFTVIYLSVDIILYIILSKRSEKILNSIVIS